jgi:hypothetical protein
MDQTGLEYYWIVNLPPKYTQQPMITKGSGMYTLLIQSVLWLKLEYSPSSEILWTIGGGVQEEFEDVLWIMHLHESNYWMDHKSSWINCDEEKPFNFSAPSLSTYLPDINNAENGPSSKQ